MEKTAQEECINYGYSKNVVSLKNIMIAEKIKSQKTRYYMTPFI